MYAYRRLFRPSQTKGVPEPHAGLGLDAYVRATSPLRRYQDLLAHQQIRTALRGGSVLPTEALAERYGVADVASAVVRRAERLSNQHWKLVYLQQNASWEGDAVVVLLRRQHDGGPRAQEIRQGVGPGILDAHQANRCTEALQVGQLSGAGDQIRRDARLRESSGQRHHHFLHAAMAEARDEDGDAAHEQPGAERPCSPAARAAMAASIG